MLKKIKNSDKTRRLLLVTLVGISFVFVGVLLYFFIKIGTTCMPYNDVMVSVQTLVTIGALLVAIGAILISMKEPKFDFYMLDQHGTIIENKSIKLAINDKNEIRYMPYSPSDWELYICNVGENIAENIKIEISIEQMDFCDKSWIYDVKNFVYGLGVFDTLVLDTSMILRQGERFRVPKIPFQYAEHELKAGDVVEMRVEIFCNNKKVITETFSIHIEQDDLDSLEAADEIMRDMNLLTEIRLFIDMQNEMALEYGHYADVDPYRCIIDKSKREIYRKIYEVYLRNDLFEYASDSNTRVVVNEKLNKKSCKLKLFWGRIYYKSIGMSTIDAEMAIRNDMDFEW